LKYFQIYSLYKDSVANENNRKEISILETNRIINEQDKINTRLKNENSIQRLKIKNTTLVIFLVISLLVIMVFIVFFIYFLLIRNKKAKQIVEEINYKLQDEIKDKEIENEELSKSEQQYRFLADHSADLITLLDRNFNCLYISPACEHFFGYLQQEMIDLGDFRNLIHPDSMESFGIEYKAMLDYREPLRFNYQVTKKDGSLFWVESNINPIFDDITKELKAMLSVSRDVSNQMDTEEALMESARQKELMIREVHHRVKNNLGILASLVNMHKKEFSDHKTLDVFSDLQFRVRAMGLVHDQLYKSRNIKELPIGDYLSNLIYIVSTTFNNNQVEIHKDLYDELLDVEITLPLGLIVNELLTNAFKYAFPEYRKGNIWVTYKALPRRKKAGIPLRRITVKDDGIGLPADFEFKNRTSMGSQIIDLLSHQIEGELKIDGSKGAFFSITFPAER